MFYSFKLKVQRYLFFFELTTNISIFFAYRQNILSFYISVISHSQAYTAKYYSFSCSMRCSISEVEKPGRKSSVATFPPRAVTMS